LILFSPPATPANQISLINDLSDDLITAFNIHTLIAKQPGYKMEFGTADFSHKSWPSLFGTSPLSVL